MVVVICITLKGESNEGGGVHPFCNLHNRALTHAILVIGLYELLGNPTT
jgi:hypothetical protein